MKNIIGIVFLVLGAYTIYWFIKKHIERKRKILSGNVCYYCKHYSRLWKYCDLLSTILELDDNSYCNRWE